MQIDYTGQYAAKEIDQTVSLTSHSARKSFIELWTFNYLFTRIVSLCLTNSKWCQTMLWHNFHDKLTVHEVPAFNGIICKLTLADYSLTKAHKWISGRCTSLQHLQWCSYDLISADCCWTQPAERRVFASNTSNQQHQKHLERFNCELMSADCSLT